MLTIIMMSIIYIVYIQRHQKLGYVSQYEVKHSVNMLVFSDFVINQIQSKFVIFYDNNRDVKFT